jgi:hypothetical protein
LFSGIYQNSFYVNNCSRHLFHSSKNMTKKEISILDLDKSLKRMIGELCWKVYCNNFINLSLRFGKPKIVNVREPRKSASKTEIVRRFANRRIVSIEGDWKIWIYLSRWRIVRSSKCLATSSSSNLKKDLAFDDLNGQRLLGIYVNPNNGATRFTFDLDTVLEVRRFDSRSKDELWLIYGRDGIERSVRGNGVFKREPLSGNKKLNIKKSKMSSG